MPFFSAEFVRKENPHLYLFQQTIGDVDLTLKDRRYLKQNMKKNDREKELTAKKSGEEDRERAASWARKEARNY